MQFSTTTYIRIFLILSLLTCLTAQLTAQKLPMKWGDIPPEDLAMTTYEADPEADAVVLGHYASIDIDLSRDYPVAYEFHVRMKILTKAGVDRASIKMNPYAKKEKITSFKAHTINKGKVTKVDKKTLFDEKVTDGLYRKCFAFSDVQVGSVIEYKYTLQSEYYAVLDNWYFQEDIPIRHSECRFMIPEYFEYVIVTNLDREFDEKDEKSRKIGNYNATSYRFVMKNVEARKEEPFITTMKDYRNNIKFQLAVFTNPYNGMKERFMHDWPNLIKLWWEHDAGGKQVKNKMNHKKILKDVESITSGADAEEVARALYKFVQNSYTWDRRFSDYVYENKLNTAYEKKSGNSAAINLSLLACLQAAEIEAYPVRISTRRHGKIEKIYPIVQQFNHVVILAKIKGKEYLLDAIHKDLTFGMLHPSSLNGEGLVMQPKQKTHEWIPLKPTKTTEVVNINLKLDTDEPTAELTGVYTGYNALYHRIEKKDKDEEDYIEGRLGDLYDFELESVEFNTKKPGRFAEVIKLKVADAITTTPDIIYINPLLMERTDERVFTLEKRDYPVDFARPYSEKYILNFKIPEGYEVETKPENIKLVLPDKSATYLYMTDVKNGVLQLRCEESLKKSIYYPQEYEALKNFFDMIFDKEAEQIILKKKS